MVLIISDLGDLSTSKVMSYLHETSVSRVNRNCHFLSYESIESLSTKLNMNSIWLRRGNFLKFRKNNHFNSEIHALNRFLHFLSETSPNCLGSLVKEYDHNKLIDLVIAKKVGLKVPETYFVFNKYSLDKFLEERDSSFITKPISDFLGLNTDKYHYFGSHTLFIDNDLKKTEFSIPSILQEKIGREFDIRVFFLKGKFFSMAIFPDRKNVIDCRDDDGNLNRKIPFKLPKEIELKLLLLMKELGLNTGSIDLICTKENEFVFLEVNPVGQFDWLSSSCNYFIEKKIAKVLKNEE